MSAVGWTSVLLLWQPQGVGSLGPGGKAALLPPLPAPFQSSSLQEERRAGRDSALWLSLPIIHKVEMQEASLHEAVAFKGSWQTWMQWHIPEGEQRLCCPVFAGTRASLCKLGCMVHFLTSPLSKS